MRAHDCFAPAASHWAAHTMFVRVSVGAYARLSRISGCFNRNKHGGKDFRERSNSNSSSGSSNENKSREIGERKTAITECY